MTSTTSVKFGCPASACGRTHTAIVKNSGRDRAETACASCRNNVIVKLHDGDLVSTEVL